MHQHTRALKMLIAQAPIILRIQGSCMEPLIPEGSSLTLSPRSFYLPGAVVVFAGGDGRHFAHRILGFYPSPKGWKYLCKGDRAPTHDALISAAQIIGQASHIHHQNGPLALHIPLTTRLRSLGQFMLYAPGIIWRRINGKRPQPR